METAIKEKWNVILTKVREGLWSADCAFVCIHMASIMVMMQLLMTNHRMIGPNAGCCRECRPSHVRSGWITGICTEDFLRVLKTHSTEEGWCTWHH